MRAELILLCLVPIWAQQCGISINAPNPRNVRIVNGVEVVKGAWPWMVMIDEDCSGAIINDQWIVTAAHCLPHMSQKSRDTDDLRLSVGDHEMWSVDDNDPLYPAQTINVQLVIKHPDFKGTVDAVGDIALVKTREPMQFNPRIQPICLPQTGQEFGENEPACYTCGWGKDKRTAKNSYALQQIHSQIVDREACNAVYYGVIKDHNICFGDGRKGTCVGDSGSPLMCKKGGKWVLAGVLSYGTHTCVGKPGVFTNVALYADWIQRQIAEN